MWPETVSFVVDRVCRTLQPYVDARAYAIRTDVWVTPATVAIVIFGILTLVILAAIKSDD